MTSTSDNRITLHLEGSETDHGLPLSNLANFSNHLRRALRDFDRQRQGARTARGGHPTTREDLVTGFRLVEFRPTGSATMELEAIVPAGRHDSQLAMPESEQLAVENFRAFIDTIEGDEILDPAVTEAIESARTQLGSDGRIEVWVGNPAAPRRHTVIDADAISVLRQRVRRARPRLLQISGRLHMLDDEPKKVGIRAADNIDWICSYPPELEESIAALMRTQVIARGVGSQTSSNRGRLEIDEIEPLEAYVATQLFTFERVPLDTLMERQGIRAPQGMPSLLGDVELSDEELDGFLEAISEQ
jgi:hypothetical protein